MVGSDVSPRQADPVLERLAALHQSGTSQAELAEQIGVKRTTLASWLADLRAIKNHEKPSASARSFIYTRQPARVQELIARALKKPQAQLHEESALSSGSEVAGETLASAPEVPGLRMLTEPVSAVLARELSRTIMGDPTWIAEDAFRVAQFVEKADGVTAVFPVPLKRGRSYRVPFQYQLAVFVDPSSDAATFERIEADVEARLDELHSSAHWENSGLRPRATLELPSGRRQTLLGSLVVSILEASRGPSAPSVLPPPASIVRLVTVVSSDYGGSKPVSGLLAGATGAGLIEAESAARARLARGGRYRTLPESDADDPEKAAADRQMGWVNQRLLYLVRQGGAAPGAWFVSTEARYLKGYPPLLDAFATEPDVLITLHLGDEWREMAAWRLAKAAYDYDHRSLAWTSLDHVPILETLVPGQHVTSRERDAMSVIAKRKSDVLSEINTWEASLAKLVDERRDLQLPTVAVTLDRLPGEFKRFAAGDRWEKLGGSEFGSAKDFVVYLDDVDTMFDAWCEAGAGALRGLLDLAEFSDEARERFYGKTIRQADSNSPLLAAKRDVWPVDTTGHLPTNHG